MRQLSLRKGFAFAAALLLVGAAIAVAVATHGSGSTRVALTPKAMSGDPDAGASLKETPFELKNGAVRAEEEKYRHKAYPAKEIPHQATVAAGNAFMKVQKEFEASLARTPVDGANPPVSGQWQAYGQPSANFPGVLTFFGADYTTSGRTTAMAISPVCTQQKCQLWIGAAGGGVWRTNNALAAPPGQGWQFISGGLKTTGGGFGSNNFGYLLLQNNVLYAGTGESHASGDSGAGMGIWKSTDGGVTWTQLPAITHTNSLANGDYTGNAFAGRAISSIVVDPNNPNIIYVGSARGVRGVSSVTGSATSNPSLPRPPFGLFKSTDGGQTFDFVWDGNGTIRGVTRVLHDPRPTELPLRVGLLARHLALDQQRGDMGADPRASAAAIGRQRRPHRVRRHRLRRQHADLRGQRGPGPGAGEPPAEFWRSDNARAAHPTFTNLTNDQVQDYCTGQCWYDQIVMTPAGHPNIVYVGGSYDYNNYARSTNGRALLLSRDGGVSWTDQTADATLGSTPPGNCCNPNPIAPNGQHPDHHVLVTNPNNPLQFFDGSDGGVVRSSGKLADISWQCEDRGLEGDDLDLCEQLLSGVPTLITSLNKGLNTLQFQSVWVATRTRITSRAVHRTTARSRTTGPTPSNISGRGRRSSTATVATAGSKPATPPAV